MLHCNLREEAATRGRRVTPRREPLALLEAKRRCVQDRSTVVGLVQSPRKSKMIPTPRARSEEVEVGGQMTEDEA